MTYEADLREAAGSKGKRIVRLICGGCAHAKKKQDAVIGSIFDSTKGPLFESVVTELPLLNTKDDTGRRQKPAQAIFHALLNVPPDRRRNDMGGYRSLHASCPRHGELTIDEAALHGAVSAFRDSAKVRTVELDVGEIHPDRIALR